MLEHLGEKGAADRLMRAIERVTANPSLHTPDLGGSATTRAVTDATIEAIEGDSVQTGERILNKATLPDIGFDSYDSMEGLIAIDRGAPSERFASWPGAKLIHAVYPGVLVAGTIAFGLDLACAALHRARHAVCASVRDGVPFPP